MARRLPERKASRGIRVESHVPDKYRDREFYHYNVEIMLMRTNVEEFAALGD